jgi:hypothetical protein
VTSLEDRPFAAGCAGALFAALHHEFLPFVGKAKIVVDVSLVTL